jgi:hypothetical protein
MRLSAIAALALLALGLFAQPSRDAYREAYRAWRQAATMLERDSGAAPPTLAARVQSVTALAATYGSEKTAFLRRVSADQEESLAWLETPPPALAEPARGVRENVAAESAIVKRNLETFSNDPDPAIQQLRAMLDRENTALAALSKAVAERQAAAESTQSALASAEQAKTKAMAAGRELAIALRTAADESDRESAAWAEYYGKLAVSARAAPASGPSTSTSPRSGSMPLPLTRYTGAWTFPSAGLFHGAQPEFLDLVVHEQNGRADGTLFARFKLPPGSKDDPVLRFDFSGDFKNTRNQVFALETSDGTKGTLELIPGPAFNLLEINFLTDAKPGKIRSGNAVLVKK